ncbi:MAG: hypothetical protein CL880_03210 [Dehalococcoidia bacterium]|nr:hypothetical protein [Dehalococcoidia bacterium]
MDHYRPSVGTKISELDTPCLILDLDALDHNFDRMSETFKDTKVKLREHTKNIKSPALAHMQIRKGGTVGGVCSAKVAEAEVMVEGGIASVLIPNQVVTEDKIKRLCVLAGRADVTVCVDSEENVRDISRIASNLNVKVGIAIEVDTNMDRAGVRSVEQGVHIASVANQLSGLNFRGVMSHSAMFGVPKDDEFKNDEAIKYYKKTVELADAIRAKGIEFDMVSSGETFSYDMAPFVDGITEVEGGMYALMSTMLSYMDGHFKYAAKILGTVVSQPKSNLAVGDIGYRSIASSLNTDDPFLEGYDEVEFTSMHDEACLLTSKGEMPLTVGDKFMLRCPQQDLTVNRYDNYIAVRNGLVEQVISIPGRGCHN